MNQPSTHKKTGEGRPGYSQNPHANHRATTRRTQPPFAKSTLERLPKFFCVVIYLGNWDAASTDPRPAVLIPENADVLDYDWSRLFKAARIHQGHKVVIIERGRVSEDRAKAVAMSLLAIGFTRVIVCADATYLEDGAPMRIYGAPL